MAEGKKSGIAVLCLSEHKDHDSRVAAGDCVSRILKLWRCILVL
jgi:hypothetical protein